MGALEQMNKDMFGGSKTTGMSLLNEQQQGVVGEMMDSANTYRGLADQQKSLHNAGWEGMQSQQVMLPLQQRMADNMRDMKTTSRKKGRALSSIGKRLQESSSLRMNQMKMQQGVIENQRRISMEQEARQRSLGYQDMASQQLGAVTGRRSKENIIEQDNGFMGKALQGAQALATANNMFGLSGLLKSDDKIDPGMATDIASGGLDIF